MAVDDFLAFKRLMVKRNSELNQQVLNMQAKMDAEKESKEEGKVEDPPKETRPSEEPADKQPTPVSDKTLTDKNKEKQELREAMRVAHELEKAEEEEMMKRAIEASEKAAQ